MITQRDQTVLNFIEDFRAATSGQICRLFFPGKYRYCMKRLEKLCKDGHISRTISTINNCHAYYIGKRPAQLHHDLIRAELFVCMSEHYKVLSWLNEEPVKNIRPDALALVEHRGITYPLFIEIHLNNKFDFEKYENLIRTTDLRQSFGMTPRLIICTDRRTAIPNIGLRIKIIGLDMSGIDALFK